MHDATKHIDATTQNLFLSDGEISYGRKQRIAAKLMKFLKNNTKSPRLQKKFPFLDQFYFNLLFYLLF